MFADSCNFIHSAKFANEITPQTYILDPGSILSEDGPHIQNYAEPSPGEGNIEYAGPSNHQSPIHSQRLTRTPSQSTERKRRSVRSPPRSPRLSGLLFALQSVIGPDVEEEEVSDEGDTTEGGREPLAINEISEPSSSVLPSYYSSSAVEASLDPSAVIPKGEEMSTAEVDLPDVDVQEASELLLYPSQDFAASLSSPFDGSFNLTSEGPGFSMLSDFPEPPECLPALGSEPLTSTPKRSPSSRAKLPSPIVTQYSPMDETQVLDNNVIEIRQTYEAPLTPSRGSLQSTLDLLSSPFSSPAKRILSPQFGARELHSPIFGMFSGNATPIRKSKVYADDDVISLETVNSPVGSQSSVSERKSDGSFSTDNAQTPKSNPHIVRSAEAELEDIPPLPETSIRSIEGANGTLKDDEGEFTITAVSQMDASSFVPSSSSTSFTSEESSWGNVNLPYESEEDEHGASYDEDDAASDGSRSLNSPTVRSALVRPVEDIELADFSGGNYSLDPSPLSADLHSTHTSETLVDSPVSPEERKKVSPRRLTFRSFSSPTKAIRDSSCPPSLEKTVRPEPSPLVEEYPPPRSASSMSSHSSQKTTWDEMSASSSQKVTFGFRRSNTINVRSLLSLI